MSNTSSVVYLLDVDNTLLDNDRITVDMRRFLEVEVGAEKTRRYWEIFEDLRNELGYADYLGALQRYRLEDPRDPKVLTLSSYLIDYPFANRLYPESLDVVDYLKGTGPSVILSDGDVVFQPRKVERSGLWSAVDGNVLIYVHKEHELDDVEARYPAEHYVIVDDKLRVLAALKKIWGERGSRPSSRPRGPTPTIGRSSPPTRPPTLPWSGSAICSGSLSLWERAA